MKELEPRRSYPPSRGVCVCRGEGVYVGVGEGCVCVW